MWQWQKWHDVHQHAQHVGLSTPARCLVSWSRVTLKSSLSPSLSSPYHPWWAFLSELLDFSFYFHPHFLVLFLSFLSMHFNDLDSMTNNLRDSAKVSLVTYDDTFPLTQCTTSTPMTTLTLTIAWCTSFVESAHSAHCSTVDDYTAHLMAQVLSPFLIIHGHIHGAFPLTRSLPSSFTCPSCPSPSSSSIPSCSLSPTTRSSWQVCATPPQKRVRTPWTFSPLRQVMSPTSWPSTRSTTHQSPFSFMISSTD